MKDCKSLVSCYAVTIMVDLDATLFVVAQNNADLELVKKYKHFTKSSETLYDNDCYLIFYEKTKSLFEFLLSHPNIVRIGFITAAEYDAAEILAFLEISFDLPFNSLQNAMFINAFNFGGKQTLKGCKLDEMRTLGVFGKNERVLLLDDNPYQLIDAKEHGFDYLHATGFYVYHEEVELEDKSTTYKAYIEVNDEYFATLHDYVTQILAKFKNTNPLQARLFI